MKNNSALQSAFVIPRAVFGFFCLTGLVALLLGLGVIPNTFGETKSRKVKFDQRFTHGEKPKPGEQWIASSKPAPIDKAWSPDAPDLLVMEESFDGVTPPALPSAWTADQGQNAGGFPAWVTSNSGDLSPPADSFPNSAFTPDGSGLLDNRLYSAGFTYNSASAWLSFRHNYNLEAQDDMVAYDCGVLEISINGGDWTDIVAAGGSFFTGGYDHTGISSDFSNPLLPSRPNWSGTSNGFITTVVTLPAAGVGQPVKVRWRMGSDESVGIQGWRVDNVRVTAGPSITGAGSSLQTEGCSPPKVVSKRFSKKKGHGIRRG